MRPSRLTGVVSTRAPSCVASQVTGSSSAWCSTALKTIRSRRGSLSRRAQYKPLMARLFASVPPEQNTTSLGRPPSRSAMSSRASSTVRRAARPDPCRLDALPVRASSSVITAIASGTIGVVAAWSR
jgi:hypothetical protein